MNIVTLERLADRGWIEIRSRKHTVTDAGLDALASLVPPASREEKLLRFLSGNPGVSRTGIIRGCFGGNISVAKIGAILDELLGRGAIRTESVSTRGRPATCYYLAESEVTA